MHDESADSKRPTALDWAARNASWMGVACLLNARRCGRMRCHFTGPFFLAMAVASLLFSLGALPLGSEGWAFKRLWERYRSTS